MGSCGAARVSEAPSVAMSETRPLVRLEVLRLVRARALVDPPLLGPHQEQVVVEPREIEAASAGEARQRVVVGGGGVGALGACGSGGERERGERGECTGEKERARPCAVRCVFESRDACR